MTMGSPLASVEPSPGVDETKAICFASGDQASSFPVPGNGELLPARGARDVVSVPSGRAIKRLWLSASPPRKAIHLLSPDHRGPPAGLSPPRRTLFSVARSITQSWP